MCELTQIRIVFTRATRVQQLEFLFHITFSNSLTLHVRGAQKYICLADFYPYSHFFKTFLLYYAYLHAYIIHICIVHTKN